jgi:hypothetical protein
MRRVAFFALIIIFFTTNYAYGTFPIEELSQTIEGGQYQDLPQEDIDEIFLNLVGAIDWESVSQGDLSSIDMEILNDIVESKLGISVFGTMEANQSTVCALLPFLSIMGILVSYVFLPTLGSFPVYFSILLAWYLLLLVC